MIACIFIVVFALLGITAFIFGIKEPSDSDAKKFLLISGAVVFVLSLLGLFGMTFTVVQATEVGVPVSFGHVGAPLDPGIHFVAPWTSVDSYPTRPITVQLAGADKVIARTADAGQMSVEIAARWHVEKQDASKLYYQSRTGDLNSISDNIVLPNLRQAVGQIYSVTGNLDAISNRDKVAEDIRIQLNKQLVPYGIAIDTVSMRSVEPDATTAATISQYASQQQATRIAQEATKTATYEAQRRLIEAKGLEAAGKAAANLTPSQLESVCIQVWQQTITAGIKVGVPVYTNPCATTAQVIVNSK